MGNLFEQRTGGGTGSREIKAWVREWLALDDEVTILVTELQCHEPGCPPVETVMALLRQGQPTEQMKIHLPMAEVTREDVARAWARQVSQGGSA